MKGAKKLLWGAISLFVLFCIYWTAGRAMMVKTLTSGINDMQSEGYTIAHKGMAVGGFPLQFRAQLIEPDIASPRNVDKSWSIKSEHLVLNASTFDPLRWTAKHRGDARLDIRGPKGERWLFDARPFIVDMKSHVSPTGKIKAVKATVFRLKTQAVIGTLPPIIAIDSGFVEAAPHRDDMQIDWRFKNTFLEQDTLKLWQKAFGPRLELIEGTALAIGLTSLEKETLSKWKETGKITCETWTVIWGDTTFHGSFDLTQSQQGLSGIINVQVDDISRLISRLEEAGILTQRQARAAALSSVLLPVNEDGNQELNITLREDFLILLGQKIYQF